MKQSKLYENGLKRVGDILTCLVLFPFFLLLIVVVGILIKMEDGGPIFYNSKRLGKNFVEYNMVKFRTMYTGAPNLLNEDGSTYNSKHDTRVTKIGRILRETSLDEIPQIVNVLKGDMSLVGPRPGDVEARDTYKEDEKEKLSVLPGITGYTQAYYRNSLSVREKRLHDVWYAQNISLWLDLKIILKTILVVLLRKNIYTN